MNYTQATQEIFNELKEFFTNGALGIEPSSIEKAYVKRNMIFDFKQTQDFFKSQNLLFTKLIDAPKPFKLHPQINKELIDYYFLYDKSINSNPLFLQCV